MKNKNNMIIGLYSLILMGIVIFGVLQFLIPSNMPTEENIDSSIKIDKKNYTVKLVLSANYSGWGEGGQFLGSGQENKTYDISKGDTFYEPCGGGTWIVSPSSRSYRQDEPAPSPICGEIRLRIVDFDDNNVNLIFRDKNDDEVKNSVNYNKSLSFDSVYIEYDGINYDYEIKFEKTYK